MGFYNNDKIDDEYTSRVVTKLSERNTDWLMTPGKVFESLSGAIKDSSLEPLWEQQKTFWDKTRGVDILNGFRDGLDGVGLTPSTSEYSKCKTAKGVSAWDEHGWRCLFPKDKAEVEMDKTHQRGLFFKDFDSLMDWRVKVKELTGLKKEEKSLKVARDNVAAIYEDYHKDLEPLDTTPKSVMKSKVTRVKTLDNGDWEETTEISTTYDDGRVQNEKSTKIIPFEEKKSGWIWK